jgi:acetoin utilization protein AcuC
VKHLLSFHTPELLELVKQGSITGNGFLDQGDTPARLGIFEAASTVVGSVLKLVDHIMSKKFQRGFVPIAGLHHGYRDRCSGFCIFNDCAIAIQHLRHKHGVNRILYVDIDAHHGDGVLYSFESDASLFIVDFHEDGEFLYPGSGDSTETGKGAARGTKKNFPMPMYADDEAFASYWPEAEQFMHAIKPEMIIFQCGADSMKGDPITHLQYSVKTFQMVTESLCRIADIYCQGRIIGLGGGGYNLDNIAMAWPKVVRTMLETG